MSVKNCVWISIIVLVIMMMIFSSCRKYLDKNPDLSQTIPSTIEDARALTDNASLLNDGYPLIGTQSDDDYYVTYLNFQAMTAQDRDRHIWHTDIVEPVSSGWGPLYQGIYNVNIALETISKINPPAHRLSEWKEVKGAALFFRAYAFYHVAQYFAEPYKATTATSTLGIPLRLSPDPNPVSVRATLEESWQRIVTDLKDAVNLLPVTTTVSTRPSRPAAWAMLARVYLAMDKFEDAGRCADSSLALYNVLMDYNTLPPASTHPFQQFNPEVLFSSVTAGSALFTGSSWLTDTTLYRSYDNNDLRKVLFFRPVSSGSYTFKGNYADGSGQLFNGIAVDEVYLIRAECAARTGNKQVAMDTLNALLKTRWKNGFFIELTATTADEALVKVLTERRKELVGRSIRWFDLRRLNKETRFAKTLTRILNNVTYTLPPNDPRYTFPIPVEVINATGMQQNPR